MYLTKTLIPAQTDTWTVAATTGGSGKFTINEVDYASNFGSSLEITLNTFVANHAAALLLDNIIVTATSPILTFAEAVQGLGFDVTFTNTAGTYTATGYTSLLYPEPVTKTELKSFCGIAHSSDDSMIEGIITQARELAEQVTNRSFIAKSIVYSDQINQSEFSETFEIRLPNPDHTSITEVKVNDTVSEYTKTGTGRYIVTLPVNTVYEGLKYADVKITYTAGNCPALAKQAILQIGKDMYENRGKDPMSGNGVKLLSSLKIYY